MHNPAPPPLIEINFLLWLNRCTDKKRLFTKVPYAVSAIPCSPIFGFECTIIPHLTLHDSAYYIAMPLCALTGTWLTHLQCISLLSCTASVMPLLVALYEPHALHCAKLWSPGTCQCPPQNKLRTILSMCGISELYRCH